jgi:hypothetical protein
VVVAPVDVFNSLPILGPFSREASMRILVLSASSRQRFLMTSIVGGNFFGFLLACGAYGFASFGHRTFIDANLFLLLKDEGFVETVLIASCYLHRDEVGE